MKPPTAGSSEQPTPTPDQLLPGAAKSRTVGDQVIDERESIEAAQRDPAQFAALYEDNFARVYGYIARRVRDRSVAEDLTSEVFHHALASLPRFEWRGVPFGAWLIRIAANAISDRSKRASREQEIVIASEAEIQQYPDSAAGLQDSLEEVECRARLFRLVDALPPDQRRVIVMRFAEEKSIRDIAQQIGRTEGAVKQLQFRALQNLRSELTEE